MRTRSTAAAAAAAALLLAACGDDGGEEPATDAGAEDGADDTGAAPDDGEAPGEDPMAGEDLPDPNDDVQDGVYTGNGIRVPVPDGFELDPMAAAQGLIAAIDAEGQQQVLAQALDIASLPDTGEELTLDTLVEDNRGQFAGQEPTVDEAIELSDGSTAHQLVFEALPPTGPGAAEGEGADAADVPAEPDIDVAVIVADDGEGRLAQFSYLAPTDAFDDAIVTALVEEAGFDPDSDPAPPVPPAPEGELEGEAPPEGDIEGEAPAEGELEGDAPAPDEEPGG